MYVYLDPHGPVSSHDFEKQTLRLIFFRLPRSMASVSSPQTIVSPHKHGFQAFLPIVKQPWNSFDPRPSHQLQKIELIRAN